MNTRNCPDCGARMEQTESVKDETFGRPLVRWQYYRCPNCHSEFEFDMVRRWWEKVSVRTAEKE